MTRLPTALLILLLPACEKPPATGPADATTGEPAPSGSTDWPIARGGPQLQGRVKAALFHSPTVEWTADLGHPVVAEAATADGALVVGDVAGTIHCLDLATRKVRWKVATGDTIQAAPAIANGRVFVGSGDGTFLALDLLTGNKLWSVSGKDKFSSAASVVTAASGSGDWLLVNGYDGITRCLSPADGSVIWTYQTNDPINGTPAVIDGRLVAFGGCDKAIHVLNLATGTLVNRIPTESQITNSVATDGTMIYCGSYANQVIAAEAAAKSPAWIYEDAGFPFFTAPAIDDHRVYIGSRDKSLHAIHRATGQRAWTFKTGGRVESSPLAFDNAIVFGSNDGRLYAANPADGREIWRLELGEDLTAPPIYANGRLIIAGGDGTLFVIAPATRQP